MPDDPSDASSPAAGQDGQALLRRAQAGAAMALHEEVVGWTEEALARSRTDPPEVISELHFLRGDSLRHLGRWEEAREAFQRVVSFDGEPPLTGRAARAWRLLSEIDRRRRDFDAAAAAAEAAADAAERTGDPAGRALAQLALARTWSDIGRGDDARRLVDDAAARAQADERVAAEDRPLLAVAVATVLALLLFRVDDLAGGVAVLAAVKQELPRVRHAITLAAFHRQVAILHEIQRNYSAAIRHLNLAVDLYERVRYEPGRYDANWSLALCYTNLGDLRTASLCLEQAAGIAERLNLRLELGKAKSSFAELHMREGHYAEAVALYREDLAISESLGDEQALGHCNRKLANGCRLLRRPADALRHAEASVQHFEDMGRRHEANLSRVLVARVLVDLGLLDEAARTVGEAEAALSQRSRPAERAAVMRAAGQVAQAQGRHADAVAAFEGSAALQNPSQPSRELASTLFEAGLACRSDGRHEAAVGHLRQAIELAGLLGSRDLWQRAVDALEQMDLMAAQQMKLKPYLPGGAVVELSSGEAPARVALATVMFVDMRGATVISGTLGPLEMAEVVAAFLGPVVRILLRWGGTVDKFIGDCVMAVFGPPHDDGADAAVQAGIEIIEYMEATRAVRRRAEASVLEASIGINTGDVAYGCFGPLLRRDYTVLGYHVNLAQRLQSVATSVYSDEGSRIIISETTRARLTREVPVDPLDLTGITMKGINTGVVAAWWVKAREVIEGKI